MTLDYMNLLMTLSIVYKKAKLASAVTMAKNFLTV